MNILLIGAASLLGKKILECAPKKYSVIPTYHSNILTTFGIHLDITQRERVHNTIRKVKPDIIIHTSSKGNVDYCETHQNEAWQVNVTGTQNIVDAAKTIKAKYIFFSSNAVFDGRSKLYNEESPTNPLNFYGKSKVEGETITKTYLPNSLIFRLTTMYGWNDPNERKNPATWLLSRLKKNIETPIVTDVYNNHLWVGQAANCVWKAITTNNWGQVFHIAGKECVSRYEFACELARTFNLDATLLKPVKSNYFPNITPRAHNTCFDTSKMEQMLNITPLTLIKGLQLMKNDKYL